MNLLLNFLCNCFINNVYVLKGNVCRRNCIMLFHLPTFSWGRCQLSLNCQQGIGILTCGVCTLVFVCVSVGACLRILSVYLIVTLFNTLCQGRVEVLFVLWFLVVPTLLQVQCFCFSVVRREQKFFSDFLYNFLELTRHFPLLSYLE